jgi:hypothetical protein
MSGIVGAGLAEPDSSWAREELDTSLILKASAAIAALACGFSWERVTGIEPALSAWELDRSMPVRPLTSQPGGSGVAVADRS